MKQKAREAVSASCRLHRRHPFRTWQAIDSQQAEEIKRSIYIGITARHGCLRGRIGVESPWYRLVEGLMSSQQITLELYMCGMSVGVKETMVVFSWFAVGMMVRGAA
jgi:hypothetical protein